MTTSKPTYANWASYIYNNKPWQIIPIGMCLGAIAIYYYSIFRFAVNFPYSDDYVAILEFIGNYKQASFWEKGKLIISQHNEHRIVLTRLASILQFEIFGKINFFWLQVVGNIPLVFIWWSMVATVRNKAWFNWWLLVPPTFLLFQFMYIEISFFSMAGLSGCWVLGLAALTLTLTNRMNSKTNSLLPAAIAACICTFTQGNGWLIFPVVLVIMHARNTPRRLMIAWLAVSLFALAAYAYNYVQPTHAIGKINFGSPAHWWRSLLFFFSFLGGGLLLPQHLVIPFGILLLALLACAYRGGSIAKNPWLMGMCIFIVFSAAITALNRSPFGIEFAASKRYLINLAIFDGLILLLMFEYLGASLRMIAAFLATTFSIWFCSFTYLYILRWKLYEEPRIMVIRANAHNGQLPNDFHYYWWNDDKTIPKRILKKAESEGIYSIKDF